MNYSTPMLTIYGDSSNLIKGDCDWGTENWWADKTGYYKYTYSDCIMTVTCATFGDCHCGSASMCTTSQPRDQCSSDSDC